jgi:hypothetical protein
MTLIPCPGCGSTQHWRALEQQQWMTPCDLVRTSTGIEIEIEPTAETGRDMASAVTVAYVCSANGCQYIVEPDRLNDELKEASVGEEERPVQQPGESFNEFSNRKGAWDARQRTKVKNEADDATPKESPLVKFGRVFGGPDA